MKKEDLEQIRKIVAEELNKRLPYQFIQVVDDKTGDKQQPCLHDGLKEGDVHLISCPCPQCSPRC